MKEKIAKLSKETNYIIDTCVFINTPDCIEKMCSAEKKVIIPDTVVSELEHIKDDRKQHERSRKARIALSYIKKHMKGINVVLVSSRNFINDDVDNYYLSNIYGVSEEKFEKMTGDEKIVFIAKCIKANGLDVSIITDDVGMMISARNWVDTIAAGDMFYDPLYRGRDIFTADDISELFNDKKIEKSKICPEPHLNEYMVLTDNDNASALARFDGKNAVPLIFPEAKPMKIKPRNAGQRFEIESLMDDSMPLSIIYGPAGTGKTFLALACGLEKCRKNLYEKIVLCRPYITSDENIGALPGDEFEKVTPLHRSASDNLREIANISGSKLASLSGDIIDIEAFSFIRGRSIRNSFIIVDEAQNMTITQVKTLITRAGEGTKIVLLGDITQIDNPKLSRFSNGLVFTINAMKNSPLCSIVSFDETECTRSSLAREAVLHMKEDDRY